jgi:ketosteroid isomerase-like protein
MRKTKIIIAICIAILTVSACSMKQGDLTKAEMRKIVDDNNLKLKEYFEKQDIENLANMYCDSAKLSPNGGNFVIGRDSIKAFWAEDFKTSKVLDMQTNTLTVNGNSNVIYETGKTTSKILYMDSVYIPTVKFINVWVKQANGKFLLDVDFWNKDEVKKK